MPPDSFEKVFSTLNNNFSLNIENFNPGSSWQMEYDYQAFYSINLRAQASLE
jgi:hypothetical protein